MELRLSLLFTFLCFLQISKGKKDEICIPTVKFNECHASDKNDNSLWNIVATTNRKVSLTIEPACKHSHIQVHWVLLDKGTKRVSRSMKEHTNRQSIVLTPKVLAPGEYVLLARITEVAFMRNGKEIEAECWIKVAKKSLRLEHLAPRVNRSNTFAVTLHTNTPKTGWPRCANHKMQLCVEEPKPDATSLKFFAEIYRFDNWVRDHTWWIVGRSWKWTVKTTYMSRNWLAIKTVYTRTTTLYGRMANNTGHIGYPTVYAGLFPQLQFSLRKNVYHLSYKSLVTYGKKFRLMICDPGDVVNLGCRNMSDIGTCMNHGFYIECKNYHEDQGYFRVNLKCTINRNYEMPKHLSYAIFVESKTPHSKAPDHNLIWYGKSLEPHFRVFRLSVGGIHFYFCPVEYETHVRYHPSKYYNSKFYEYTPPILKVDATNEEKLARLEAIRDGKVANEAPFSGLVTNKFNDAVQVAYLLLVELETIDVKNLLRNKFHGSLLEEFAKVITWTWSDIELMLGLISRFDMIGTSKELFHSRNKILLLKNIVKSMYDLIHAHAFPLVIQPVMIEIFFPEYNREVSLMFDSDYVKPMSFGGLPGDNSAYHIAIKEEYENYDKVIDTSVRDEYISMSFNALFGLQHVLLCYASTYTYRDNHMVVYEPFVMNKVYMEREVTMDLIDTKIGKAINITFGNMKKIISKNSTFIFTWSLLDRNFFFWNTDAAQYNTLYFFHFFYDNGVEMTKGFSEKPLLYYTMIGSLSIPLLSDGIVIPTDPAEWTELRIHRFIRAYRLNIEDVGYRFALYMSNITNVKRLKVVINQDDKKPHLSDFSSNPNVEVIVFDETKTSYMTTINTKGYWYVAVLPYQEDVTAGGGRKKRWTTLTKENRKVPTTSVQYAFRFIKLACPAWHNKSFTYKICTVLPATTLQLMQCECEEIGVPIAASVGPLPYKLYGIVDTQIILHIVVEYAIIVATFMAVFFYCLLLMIAPYRSKPMELVCFLADNKKSDRFGYLIKVKTADFVKSGTTAHIGIQMHGTESNSMRHILNYPDPGFKFLRNGCLDHFLIATEASLGQIVQLELWSDCSGFAPEWYCENIRIIDLQKNITWFFNIQKRFGVMKHMSSHYYIKPTAPHDSSARTAWVYFTFHFGATHTWNVVDTSQDMSWTYMERLTVILSHVVTTFALTLLLVHPILFAYRDGIGEKYNEISFFIKYVLIVTIIVAPVNYMFAVLLRGCQKTGRFRGTYGYFSPRVHGLVWCVLILAVTGSILCCVVCGPFIAYTVVYEWLVIVILSLLLNIFLFENLFLALHAMVRLNFYRINAKKKTPNTRYVYKEIINDVENQRKFLFVRSDNNGLRPYILPLYKPLSGELMKERRKENEDRHAITITLQSLFNLWISAIFMALLLLYNYDRRAYEMTRHLKEMFVEGRFYSIRMGIYDIYNYKELIEWLNSSLVNAFTPDRWYSPYFVNDAGILNDISSKFVGNVLIRQKRVKVVEDCPNKGFANAFGVKTCAPQYSEAYASLNSSFNKELAHNSSMWWFHESKHWNNYEGVLRTYSGDGYWIQFGKSRANAYYRVNLVRDTYWFDKLTKVLIIEFLVYNANANLFSDVKLVFEREAQHLLPTFRIYTLRMANVTEKQQQFYIVMFIIYCAVSVRVLILAVHRAFIKKLKIIHDIYGLSLLFMQILNIVAIFLFIQKLHQMNDMFHNLKNTERNVYFPYNHVIRTHRLMEVYFAIILFITLLLLLKLLRFFAFTAALVKAIKKGFPSFIALWIVTLLMLLGFGCMGHILFGTTHERFRDAGSQPGFYLLLFMKAKLSNQENLLDLMLGFGRAVIIMYMAFFVVLWLTKSYFIVVCLQHLHEAKVQRSTIRRGYTLRKYFTDTISSIRRGIQRRFRFVAKVAIISRLWRRRKKAGGDQGSELVKSGPIKYRYRNPYFISDWTITNARAVIVSHFRNKYIREPGAAPTQEDIDLMHAIVNMHTKNKEEATDLYFKTRKPFQEPMRTILVPDEKMIQLARLSGGLLEDKYSDQKDLFDPNIKIPPRTEVSKPEPSLFAAEIGPKKEEEQMDENQQLHHSQTQQLDRILTILNSTDSITDTIALALFGEKPFAKLAKLLCCSDSVFDD